jgi:hypothetical protein
MDAETTQTQRGSLPGPGEITASFVEHEPAGQLDQADVRLLVDFFLLLKEWDTRSTSQCPMRLATTLLDE